MKVEDDVRYLTAETPPTDDNSNKVPTTEWVRDALDATNSGAYPTVQGTTTSGITVYAPNSGGTWYCMGVCNYNYKRQGETSPKSSSVHFSKVAASGASLCTPNPYQGTQISISSVHSICIKIA